MPVSIVFVAAVVARLPPSVRCLNWLAAMLFCAGCLAACGDAEKDQKQQQLEQAVGQVTRIINDTSRNMMAAAALQSTLEGGGTLMTYVAASLPDKFTHRITMDRPEAAWSIVLRLPANAAEATVEGYGSDLKKPLFTRTASLVPPSPRR